MDRGNCPKHVEFYFKNKFEELVHLVGLIMRIYHDALSRERQTYDICHTGLLTACEQLLASCQQTCMTYIIAVCIVKNS
jgi:hypothetical protein